MGFGLDRTDVEIGVKHIAIKVLIKDLNFLGYIKLLLRKEANHSSARKRKKCFENRMINKLSFQHQKLLSVAKCVKSIAYSRPCNSNLI